MNELTVKIKYNNTTAPFSAFEVQKAMENLFGINTDFEVEEVYTETLGINNLNEKQSKYHQECIF
ncbi:MAG: hypothetical protein KJ915_06160 [Candidatus Omnitrophica bacterium]|nr:hypothetical protein [Candidatus Omnitrophota bacterium]